MKWDVINKKDEPKRLKERPTAPLVLMIVTGLVAKLAVEVPTNLLLKINNYIV